MIRHGLFIHGKDVPAELYFEVRDPGRLTDIVAEVAIGTAADVDRAVVAAHHAFQTWRGVSLKERIERLHCAAESLDTRTSELADLLVREQGMLRRDTLRDAANGVNGLGHRRGTIGICGVPRDQPEPQERSCLFPADPGENWPASLKTGCTYR